MCNIHRSFHVHNTYIHLYISNYQTATLIHDNSLQLANILHVTHLAKYEIQTFHVRYQPPSLEVMILTLPKIEVIALGNGVVPSFVLFKWLNCIARPNKVPVLKCRLSVKCRLQTIELFKVTISIIILRGTCKQFTLALAKKNTAGSSTKASSAIL